MKRPHFSLLFLLVAFMLASLFMAVSKLIGVRPAALTLIAVCSFISLTMAIRIYFFNR